MSRALLWTGGADGTELLVEIVRCSGRWLRPGGTVALELGGDQAVTIGRELLASGFDEPEVLRDAEGDPRGILARRLG